MHAECYHNIYLRYVHKGISLCLPFEKYLTLSQHKSIDKCQNEQKILILKNLNGQKRIIRCRKLRLSYKAIVPQIDCFVVC